MLSVDGVNCFSRAAFPNVCKQCDAVPDNSSYVKYCIKLILSSGLIDPDRQYILQFRDSVNIYKSNNCIFVEINKKYIDDLQVLANMGISIALSYIFCEENIYLLHSASVVRNNFGYIFPGQSGSGKTTISRLSLKDNLVLCDELSALMLNSEQSCDLSGSTYSVLAGPRWSEFTFNPNYYNGEAWSSDPFSVYPLKAIFFPSRDQIRDYTWFEKVESIDASILLLTLFTDTVFVKALPSQTYEKVFHFFSDLVKKIPCFKIHANIDTDIWEAIDKEIEAGNLC